MSAETPITDLDWGRVPSPCFVVDRRLLERNGRILARVRAEAGCKVLLALKGFALWPAFDVLRPHLDGCCASGPRWSSGLTSPWWVKTHRCCRRGASRPWWTPRVDSR